MKRSNVWCLAVVLLAGSSFAQGAKTPAPGSPPPAKEKAVPAPAAPAAGMDMTKMGLWTRKPTNEKESKKEIQAFFKKEEELAAKMDMEGMLARMDFPVYMVTDDAKGAIEAMVTNKEQYVAMMKPMYESAPKDQKYTHKPTITVLSDSLANVVDDFTMTTGKQKFAGKNTALLVKVGGEWKWKSMVEAGWGGMPHPTAAAPAPAVVPAAAKK
ncbi:MAG: hypothetical protein ACYC8T_17865 [Myxococcaceae bacterium]